MHPQSNQPPFAVVFDMDGTLVRNHPYHVQAWRAFAEKYHLRFDEAEYERIGFGLTNADILRWLFPDEELDDARLAALGDEKEALYRDIYTREIAPAPGLRALLDELHAADVPMAVATNGLDSNVQFVLQALALRPYFRTTLSIADVQHGKPAPDIYLLAAARFGVPPQHCLVFEDSLAGMESARAAGCVVVGITSTVAAADMPPVAATAADFQGMHLPQLRALVAQHSPA